ncbi:MAG: TIR domain-containing protein, partial [Alphaproteobacteria bacterium]|nr:TIR domain-containing protein [Alphaproteobacteria bacterium]
RSAMNKAVFISHSSKDRALAEQMRDAIEQAGIGAWMAPRDVMPGQNYGEAIIEAINACKVLVILFTDNSNRSPSVLREVERAVSKDLVVVTFRAEKIVPSNALEYFLSSQHWLDAWDGPPEKHLPNLVDVTKQLVGGQLDAAGRITSRMPFVGPHHSRRGLIIASAAALLPIGGGLWWATGGMRVPPVDKSAIAVLPFDNLANDPKLGFLSLAIPAELNAGLSRTTALIVQPLESVRSVVNNKQQMSDMSRALQVGMLVNGSFWSAGPQLRLSFDISDASQNRQLSSETLEGTVADLLGLLNSMIQKVQHSLQVRMQATMNGADLGTSNTEAYEIYLRALTLAQDINDANNMSAIELLKRATGLDPPFARAHAALAESCVTRFWWNFSNDRAWLDQAEVAARESVRLSPKLPEARYALGYVFEGKGQRGDAARAYVASTRLGPNYVPALASAARFAFYMADFPRSLRMLDRVAVIDPTNNTHVRKAMCHFFAGNKDECRRENREAEQMARGIDQLTLIGFTWSWLKDFGAAERVLRRLEQSDPTALSILELRSWIYTMRGEVGKAREQMRQILARRSTFGIADEIATFYAIQGDKEQAIQWLTRAIDNGAPNYAWYKSDFFTILRGDPRYETLLARLVQEYRGIWVAPK